MGLERDDGKASRLGDETGLCGWLWTMLLRLDDPDGVLVWRGRLAGLII